ncbi:hypothetical protein [Kingella oralis]|uniref:hypothetical protein n=1 Tax=Kingella oralis TaxID=505 RepID=UPI0012DCC5ED|nr:hypothetical protein [Kingella oralis]QMT41895.1 hypothetical protein H3L93_07515 [Kingella oralis]
MAVGVARFSYRGSLKRSWAQLKRLRRNQRQQATIAPNQREPKIGFSGCLIPHHRQPENPTFN